MTAPISYSYTDTGAPVLSGTVGTLYTLLKTVLVGNTNIAYGTKASAGWTILYDNGTNAMTIQNTSGHIFAINDSAGTVGNIQSRGEGRSAYVCMFSSASANCVGNDQSPALNIVSQGGVVWYKSTTNDTTARPWKIWADSKTFYISIDCAGSLASISGVYPMFYWAGAFNSFVTGEIYNAGIGGSPTDGNLDCRWLRTYDTRTAVTPPSGADFFFGVALRDAAGGSASNYILPTYRNGLWVPGYNQNMGTPAVGTNLIFVEPILFSTSPPNTIRGTFRGLYYPINNFIGNEVWTEVSYQNQTNMPAGSNLNYIKSIVWPNQPGVVALETALDWG